MPFFIKRTKREYAYITNQKISELQESEINALVFQEFTIPNNVATTFGQLESALAKAYAKEGIENNYFQKPPKAVQSEIDFDIIQDRLIATQEGIFAVKVGITTKNISKMIGGSISNTIRYNDDDSLDTSLMNDKGLYHTVSRTNYVVLEIEKI